MSQENSIEQKTTELPIGIEDKQKEKVQTSIREFADSLKSLADDIGQISELASEEKLLVTEFFASLFKLMKPLTTAVPVSTQALPAEVGNIAQAYVDPTGHIALLHEDGQMELKNLAEERHRDIMILVIQDIMPKFKNLTSAQKNKIENRIRFLSAVTKEIQSVSESLSTLKTVAQK